jgi:hypothetical protein
MRRAFGVGMILGGIFLLNGCGSSGPKQYPVSGSVLVNGKPAALVRVLFFHEDQTLPGNLKMPMGMTDEQGVFHLSTVGARDGAVEGKYQVAFEWMSDNTLGQYDKLGGKFANPKSSTFQATVTPGANNLSPFEINIAESAIVSKQRHPE